jgi:SAM-dependent methyltransferase
MVAVEFVKSLAAPEGLRWLDVGCGTGALLDVIVNETAPKDAWGVDLSADFVETARARLAGKARIEVAEGQELPFSDDSYDVVVSGLVLNFIPDPAAAIAEWIRVVSSGGSLGVYVWDYADGMGFLRHFWDAATRLDSGARAFDEGLRFPICQPSRLQDLFLEAGLADVVTSHIEVQTAFADFDDYWKPFLRGPGPAPGYFATLSTGARSSLERSLMESLPIRPDGSITLTARAWTVTGTVR